MNQEKLTEIFAVSLLDEPAFAQIKPSLMMKVPETIREKINSFVRTNDAQRSLLGEVLARHLLKNLSGCDLPDRPFSLGEKGKPGHPGIHFNISHSGNWVVVAISDDSVGVDVEKMRKVPEGVARRFFSVQENNLLDAATDKNEKADIFFTLWTLKESFLKAIGTGLTRNLNSFTILPKGKDQYSIAGDPDAESFYLKTYHLNNEYKLAVCARSDNFSAGINIMTVEELIKG